MNHDHAMPAKGDNLVYVSAASLIALRAAGNSLTLNGRNIMARQSGNYLSRFKGRGMEFDEARQYQPGDDVRTLDWRVTARTGIPHTKLFREERERVVLTWVDMRPTMFFATRGAFKSVIAARAAALIGWSAHRRSDRFGGLVFNAETHFELRPKKGPSAVLQWIQRLSQASQWHSQFNEVEPEADHALTRLHQVAKPGSLIFLISDFRNLGPQAETHIARLSRHNDVVLFHIYDPLEQTLPQGGRYRVTWGGRSSRIQGSTRTQNHFQDQFEQRRTVLRAWARFPGTHYLDCATHDDVLDRLSIDMRPARH